MSERERCKACDLLKPTPEERATTKPGEGTDMCWSSDWLCNNTRVDWRAKAAELRRQLAAAEEEARVAREALEALEAIKRRWRPEAFCDICADYACVDRCPADTATRALNRIAALKRIAALRKGDKPPPVDDLAAARARREEAEPPRIETVADADGHVTLDVDLTPAPPRGPGGRPRR